GDTIMYTTILLAAALQDWERYSAHALAARDVAATLAKGAAQQLHVLSVYDYPPVETTDLPPRAREASSRGAPVADGSAHGRQTRGLRGTPPCGGGGGQPALARGQS